tara:strand:- start:512 stop:694 length:183 start_codon:yes stop_codon:yes gene_type:complete
MASREDIKKAILKVAGNPVTGVVKDFADAWADAIYELDNPKTMTAVPSVDKRVVEPKETR